MAIITSKPHVILIRGKLYGYGETLNAAWADFRSNISGALFGVQAAMTRDARAARITPDHASEVAECINATPISWGGG